MDWQSLLNKQRLGSSRPTESDTSRTAFQRDYDRIVFSSAFRRLQDKTQVFPLERNDYVRTRLTHSLEAASVGRSLGALVGRALLDRDPTLAACFEPAELGAICATACLAHDIGNPPFGHAGEDAISHWFLREPAGREWINRLAHDGDCTADFTAFEGNAQGFRLLTRLMFPENPGAHLTYASLATFTKYPRRADWPRSGNPAGYNFKKHGVFAEDWGNFQDVAEGVGLPALGAVGHCYARHPLVYLIEAADDICYNIVDLEDGCKMGLLTVPETVALLEAVLPAPLTAAQRDRFSAYPDSLIESLRGRAINAVVHQVVQVFLDHYEAIMDGRHERALTDDIPTAAAFAAINQACVDRIYPQRDVVLIEAAGFNVLGCLVERFLTAIDEIVEANRQNPTLELSKKTMPPKSVALVKLFPRQYLGGQDVVPAEITDYRKVLAVTDFVSSMTDHYAVTLFKRISGISLPGE